MDKPLILLVDDNLENLQFLGYLLEGTYRTAIAENGRQALEFVNQYCPDLILLDLLMPEMDGFEVCERLQRDPVTQDIPIIFLTAQGDPENVVKGLQMGAVDYVTKPFQQAELCARVQTHLALKQTRDALQDALNQVKRLSGLLPICASCKKIRDDQGYWKEIERYIKEHSEALFTHGICPECWQRLYPNIPLTKKVSTE
jgi:CheY-like chemotaxis protein